MEMNVVVCVKDSNLREMIQKKEELEVFFIDDVDDIAFSEFDLIIMDISLCSGKLDIAKMHSDKTVFVISQINEETLDELIDLYRIGEHPFKYKFSGKEYIADLDDIVYFESNHRLVRGYNEAGRFIKFYGKLDDVQKRVDDFVFFLRVNKSCLVNYNHCRINDYSVTVANRQLQVSRTYQKSLKTGWKSLKKCKFVQMDAGLYDSIYKQ